QSGMHTSSSPVTFVAPEGRSLRIGETERLVAKNSVAWSSWTAGEPVTGLERTTGLWDDSLRPKENSRSKPHAFSQAEELRAGSGSTQRLADAGPQTDERFSGMPGAVIGSMLLSSSGSLEGQARALTLFVQQLPAALDPGVGGSLGGVTDP